MLANILSFLISNYLAKISSVFKQINLRFMIAGASKCMLLSAGTLICEIIFHFRILNKQLNLC